MLDVPRSASVAWDVDCPCKLGKYVLQACIGRGAFAEVYRAVDKTSNLAVAAKRIYAQSRRRDEESAGSEAWSREKEALESLRHSNVVRLIDSIPWGGAGFLILELCATDLAEVIQQARRQLPEAVTKCIAEQMLRGIAACHAAGWLHCDVKPGNVLLTCNGIIKLADFGLASRMASSPHGSSPPLSHAVATRWYRAPELLFGARKYGAGVDMWAAGCVLAELLGLRPLFAGDSDVDQVGRVAGVLGSVDVAAWPGAVGLPDFGKLLFAPQPARPLAEVLPAASPATLHLLAHLLCYNPEDRLNAQSALEHDYFYTEPYPCEPDAIATLVEETLQRKRLCCSDCACDPFDGMRCGRPQREAGQHVMADKAKIPQV